MQRQHITKDWSWNFPEQTLPSAFYLQHKVKAVSCGQIDCIWKTSCCFDMSVMNVLSHSVLLQNATERPACVSTYYCSKSCSAPFTWSRGWFWAVFCPARHDIRKYQPLYNQVESERSVAKLFSLTRRLWYFSHFLACCVTLASGRWYRGNRG